MAENQTVKEAATTLSNSGQKEAAQQLARSAESKPGVATTISSYALGNPGAATSALGRIAPELNSREFGGMMKMAGMLALFQMLPMFGNMLGGMTNNILGSLTQSQGFMAMGNVPGNPLAKSFTEMGGVDPGSVKMLSVNPDTGVTGPFGAPAINTPAAAPLQQNTLAAVPGMSGPSLTPGGMG